jgi:mannosyltransferase
MSFGEGGILTMHGTASIALNQINSRRRHYVILSAIILIGILLRIVAIGHESLWTDEALTVVIAHWPVWDMITKPTDPTPFLYYALHKWLVPDSASVTVVRGISLVAGILALPLVYAIGRFMLSRNGALLATALAAVSQPLIDYSQEARAYSLLILLVLTSVTALLWWFALNDKELTEPAKPGWRQPAALASFVTASALAIYTHLIAIFWVGPALAILLVLTWDRPVRVRKSAWLAITMIALLVIPEATRLLAASPPSLGFDWAKQNKPWEFTITWLDTMFLSGQRLGEGTTSGYQAFLLKALVPPLAVAWICWALISVRRPLHRWVVNNYAAAVVLGGMLAIPVGIWLFGYVVRPIFVMRTILIAVPGYLLFVALLIDLDQSVVRRRIAATIILLLQLAVVVISGPVRPREPWVEVQQALKERVQPDDLVIICPLWKYPALRNAMTDWLPNHFLGTRDNLVYLVEDDRAASAHWSRLHFETLYEPLLRGAITSTQPPELEEMILSEKEPTRAWVVIANCLDREKATLRRWLGPGKWTDTWRAPENHLHPGIAVVRFDSDAVRPRRVIGSAG